MFLYFFFAISVIDYFDSPPCKCHHGYCEATFHGSFVNIYSAEMKLESAFVQLDRSFHSFQVSKGKI